MFFKATRERRLLNQIETLSHSLAETTGKLEQRTDALGIAEDYAVARKALTDAEITLARVREDHARENREIEHKLGLHKIQVTQEMAAAKKEAELSVREEALAAQKDRFSQEMKFMQDRFESEVESQRKIVEQVLERLPSFERSYQTVEHVNVAPQIAPLAIEVKDKK